MHYRNSFNNIINEELSISGEVEKATSDIWHEILSIIPKVETSQYTSTDGTPIEGLYFGYYSTRFNAFQLKITTSICVYNFLTKDAFEKNKNSINYLEATSASMGAFNMMKISLPLISGTLTMADAVKECLQHELEHIFQGKHGSNYATISDAIYAKARSFLNSPDSDIANLALIIYLSNLSEQDAFVNGLYAYLMSQEEPYIKIPWEIVKKSDAYIHLDKIRKFIPSIENPSNELKGKCIETFNINVYQFYRQAKSVEFRLTRKIGKVLAKYHKDIRMKVPSIRESFSGKIKALPDYFI